MPTILMYIGQGKLIVSSALYDLDDNGDLKGQEPGGKKRIFILAICSDVKENYANLTLIFEQLGFPVDVTNIKFII